MNKLQAVLPRRIKIIEVLEIGLGVDLEKDSTDAHYPVKVRLCDAQTDTDAAITDKDQLTRVTTIHIQTCTKSDISKGSVYENHPFPHKDNVYVKVDTELKKRKTRKVA
jgi:hypothetical protein